MHKTAWHQSQPSSHQPTWQIVVENVCRCPAHLSWVVCCPIVVLVRFFCASIPPDTVGWSFSTEGSKLGIHSPKLEFAPGREIRRRRRGQVQPTHPLGTTDLRDLYAERPSKTVAQCIQRFEVWLVGGGISTGLPSKSKTRTKLNMLAPPSKQVLLGAMTNGSANRMTSHFKSPLARPRATYKARPGFHYRSITFSTFPTHRHRFPETQ